MEQLGNHSTSPVPAGSRDSYEGARQTGQLCPASSCHQLPPLQGVTGVICTYARRISLLQGMTPSSQTTLWSLQVSGAGAEEPDGRGHQCSAHRPGAPASSGRQPGRRPATGAGSGRHHRDAGPADGAAAGGAAGVCHLPGSACLQTDMLSSNAEGSQVKQLCIAVKMANASCCICMSRWPSTQTQGLQMGQLQVAAQVGDASSVSRASWELLRRMPSTPPVMLQSAIPAPHCVKTSLYLIGACLRSDDVRTHGPLSAAGSTSACAWCRSLPHCSSR